MGEQVRPVLCACGCGQPAPLAAKTSRALGWVKGQPLTWVRGHHKRIYPHDARCSVEQCSRSIEAQGLCHSHFEFRRRHGITPTSAILDNDRDRFHAKVTVLASGHWIWRGARASEGKYGAGTLDGRGQPAHRIAWQLHRGPIPDGFEVDHLCRKTLCVNPDHLEPVPPRTNSLRSESPPAHNAAKTHCKRGHEFTPDNIRPVGERGRACIACTRTPEGRAAAAARTAAWRARQKALAEQA